jgi:hypothetical protein
MVHALGLSALFEMIGLRRSGVIPGDRIWSSDVAGSTCVPAVAAGYGSSLGQRRANYAALWPRSITMQSLEPAWAPIDRRRSFPEPGGGPLVNSQPCDVAMRLQAGHSAGVHAGSMMMWRCSAGVGQMSGQILKMSPHKSVSTF